MILTLPNLISLIRIALVPTFLWLVVARDDPTSAGVLLGVIGATDWVDGFLARRLDQISEVGKLLDPLADRLAVGAAVLAGWATGALPWPVAALLVIREGGVAVGALVLVLKTRTKLEVRYLGKLATFALYVAIPAFYINSGTGNAAWAWVAWMLALPGLALYYAAAVLYVGDMRRALAGSPPVSSGSEADSGDHR